MVQINSISRNNDFQTSLFGFFCSIFISVSMVVTVLGIKFSWFKHRMNLEPINTQVDNTMNQGVYRSSNSRAQTTSKYTTYNQVHGVFRKREDAELSIERPASLPPVRIRNSARKTLDFTLNKRFSQPAPSVPQVKDEDNFQESPQINSQYPRVYEVIIPDTPAAEGNDLSARNFVEDEGSSALQSINSDEPQVKKRLFAKQEKNRTVHFDEHEIGDDPEDKKERRPTGLSTHILNNSETETIHEDNLNNSNANELVGISDTELNKIDSSEENLNMFSENILETNFSSQKDLKDANDKPNIKKFETEIPNYFNFDQMQDELRSLSRDNQNTENLEQKYKSDIVSNDSETKLITNNPNLLSLSNSEDFSEDQTGVQVKNSSELNNENIDDFTKFFAISQEKLAELADNENFLSTSTQEPSTLPSYTSTLTESSSFQYLEQRNKDDLQEILKYYEEQKNINTIEPKLNFQFLESLENSEEIKPNETNIIKFETSSDDDDSNDDKMSDKSLQENHNAPKPEPRTIITKSMENLNIEPPKPSIRRSLENINLKNTEVPMKPFRPSLQKSLESIELNEIDNDNDRKRYKLEDINDHKLF